MRLKDCKVGMRIVGSEGSEGYVYTNRKYNVLLEIIEIGDSRIGYEKIRVKIIESNHKNSIGKKFYVDPKYFKLTKKKIDEEFGMQVGSMAWVVKGGVTKVIAGKGSVGVSCVDDSVDTYSEKFGILLATARALNMDKEFINRMVDAFYNDVEKKEDFYSVDELIEMVKGRMK